MKGKTHAQGHAFWLAQDWTQPDSVLARQLGVSASAVSLARRRLHQTDSPRKGRWVNRHVPAGARALRNAHRAMLPAVSATPIPAKPSTAWSTR